MPVEGPNHDVLIESFLSLGRVDHLTMVMALHPAYLSCFLRTQQALLELDGPLPHHWRHYISIMVRTSQNTIKKKKKKVKILFRLYIIQK